MMSLSETAAELQRPAASSASTGVYGASPVSFGAPTIIYEKALPAPDTADNYRSLPMAQPSGEIKSALVKVVQYEKFNGAISLESDGCLM